MSIFNFTEQQITYTQKKEVFMRMNNSCFDCNKIRQYQLVRV